MYPSSTKSGGAVIAFPDVCVTPSSPAPVPVPYPTGTTTLAKAVPSKLAAAGITYKTKALSASAVPTLRAKLGQIHAQLIALPGSDPDRWHMLLDDYVQSTAQLYKALADGR